MSIVCLYTSHYPAYLLSTLVTFLCLTLKIIESYIANQMHSSKLVVCNIVGGKQRPLSFLLNMGLTLSLGVFSQDNRMSGLFRDIFSILVSLCTSCCTSEINVVFSVWGFLVIVVIIILILCSCCNTVLFLVVQYYYCSTFKVSLILYDYSMLILILWILYIGLSLLYLANYN